MNIIKTSVQNKYNYFCTWFAQNYYFGLDDPFADEDTMKTNGGIGRGTINEKFLFGKDGVAVNFHKAVRKNFILVLDDGWDLPYSDNEYYMGCGVINNDRFPSFSGSPQERLKKISQKIKELGWQGLGLWICCQVAISLKYDRMTLDQRLAYFKTRIEWSKFAGVKYWKVDWGCDDYNLGFRHALVELGKEIYPELIIEHSCPSVPLNKCDEWDNYNQDKYERTLMVSDVFRTYDVTAPLSVTTTLDRVSHLLKNGKSINNGILNCEDELYIGAVLGCSLGLMRYDLKGRRYFNDPDIYLNGQRGFKYRMDEILRASNFQRLCEPVSVNFGCAVLSEKKLYDTHHFLEKGDAFMNNIRQRDVVQSAPSKIARNCALPVVHQSNKAIFITADRNIDIMHTKTCHEPYICTHNYPNDILAIGTFSRNTIEEGYFFPICDVIVEAQEKNDIFAVFGYYNKLTIKTSKKISKIYAQDLKSDQAINITDEAVIDKDSFTLTYDLIRKYGQMFNDTGDISDPGFLIQIL